MEQSVTQKGVVSHSILTYWQDGQEQRLTVGTAQWYSWLERAMSFRFSCASGAFTAQKARSGNGRGGWYWRAYCRRHGRLLRCYLGKSEDLSLERLCNAAQQLLNISDSNERHEFVNAPSSNLTAVVPEDTLVFTKLFIPRLSRQHISRPHLLALLDRAVETSLLTLVSAPAGSGKTTLLAEWSAMKQDMSAGRPQGDGDGSSSARPHRSLSISHIAWLALESADDDAVRLLRYVIAALAHFDPRLGQQARTLLRLAQGGNVEQVLTSLINDLATYLTQDVVLILDDYHLITTPAIHTLLLFLLDHMPPHLRLVIGARSDPPLPLTRLRARGQLSEVRGEDLRFVPSEAAAFVREMGIELNANDQQSLEQCTEGWIAGIQLLALALRGRANPAALLNTFAGKHRFIADYLSDEVLQRQPIEQRDFLLRTSILERLCGPLCDALTGRSDGQAQLSALRQANLFISALDEAENWYRYHPLFATALRERLQRQEPNIIAELYRRAGAWYEQQDLLFQAVEYTLRACDYTHAADLMEPLARTLVQRGDLTALQNWAEQLPNEVLFAHPRLCLATVWVFLFDGQEVRMREMLAQVEGYLREHQHESTTQEWRELRGELHIFEALAALPHNDTDTAIKQGRAALEVLSADAHYLRNLASLSIAIAMSATYRANGDIAAAENVLVRLNTEHMEGSHVLSMIAIHDLTELYQAQGHLHKMAQYYEHLLSLFPVTTELPPWMFFSVYANYVSLMYEWNRLDEAATSMDRIVQAHNQGSGLEWIFSLMPLLRANISLAQGRVDEALQMLRELDNIINTGTIPPPIRAHADAQRAYILLGAGRLEEAQRWVHECHMSGDDQINEQLDTEHFFQQMTLARALIAQARSEQNPYGLAEVLKLLDTWCHFSKQRGFNGLLIEALALEALAFEACDNVQQALAALRQALILAEPEGYIRTFADKGEPMARLLTSLAAHPQQRGTITPTYIHSLLAAITHDKAFKLDGSSSVPRHSLPTTRHAPLIEPLTPREQEVLTLLADGASNQVIADQLTITPNTAKRHVKHILGKLGATNRVQAVRRARELNVLSPQLKDTP
ncbi:helix-turn-helix transcriptional regulator [Reticulibacter mediterranei]|uniref:Helix-turn-helix transcriptional regulator n=1 Tax=Reticulibacter mediterranei TaxID=2778369 RepID=A0A8J3IJ06_9CHLR|nr:LuxR C-terminal-related transcriptional regulator [Reticulibacter mediterranei]GHO90546.1 helix-turn-helix transcriptional regulator [Reticulibacter mediterranei]